MNKVSQILSAVITVEKVSHQSRQSHEQGVANFVSSHYCEKGVASVMSVTWTRCRKFCQQSLLWKRCRISHVSHMNKVSQILSAVITVKKVSHQSCQSHEQGVANFTSSHQCRKGVASVTSVTWTRCRKFCQQSLVWKTFTCEFLWIILVMKKYSLKIIAAILGLICNVRVASDISQKGI